MRQMATATQKFKPKVLALAKLGMSVKQIKEKVPVSRATVYRWLQEISQTEEVA